MSVPKETTSKYPTHIPYTWPFTLLSWYSYFYAIIHENAISLMFMNQHNGIHWDISNCNFFSIITFYVYKKKRFKHFHVLSLFMTYHRFVTSVTRRVPLVEHELLILSQHMSSTPLFSRVRAVRSLVFCVVFCRSLFVPLFLFLSTIVLSDLLRMTSLVFSNSSLCSFCNCY